MRLQAKIETLTPVHIGSGTKYTNHLEFIYERENNDYWGGIVDIEKIYNIIGEENIHLLTLAIERKQNIVDFVKPYVQNLKLEDITKRIFFIYGKDLRNKQDIKEHIHSAGKPIIPGSSIKGAVRTAILSHLIKKFPQPAKDIINNYKPKYNKQKYDKNSEQWTKKDFSNISKQIESFYFANTKDNAPNNDLMRFIAFSDAHFATDETIATEVKTLSLQRYGWQFKSFSQLVECLAQGITADVYITINDLQLNQYKNRYIQQKLTTNIQTELLTIVSSTEKLCQVINNHTRSLLQREIELWQKQIHNAKGKILKVVQNYLNGLQKIFDDLQTILDSFTDNSNQCILRLGAYEGWEFITGAWANAEYGIFTEKQWQTLFHQLNRKRDTDLFPKTRHLDYEGNFMGFVRIIFDKKSST